MQVLFVQGGGEGVHDEWDNKLVARLSRSLGSGYDVLYPPMPDESNPAYPSWAASLLRELARLGPGAVAVGHSIGAAILINTLAARPAGVSLAGLFLVAAPFIGQGGWPPEGFEPAFQSGASLPPGLRVYLYQGSADETVPPTHVELYAEAIPDAVVRRLRGRDHQLGNDLSEVARDIRALT
jgi:predicted alpha/beta hydrolase family esterase